MIYCRTCRKDVTYHSYPCTKARHKVIEKGVKRRDKKVLNAINKAFIKALKF